MAILILSSKKGQANLKDSESKEDRLRLMHKLKQTLRRRLLEERAMLSVPNRQQLQTSVLAYVEQYLQKQKPGVLGIYWPIKGELDCRSIAETLINSGWQLAVPVINDATKQLDFAHWQPDTPMVNSTWNIPVPANPEWSKPEHFLIPLVGFDANNYRLGYGGGYYDRTLATQLNPVTKIGVGFEMGRLASIHPNKFDIAMDIVITETGLQYKKQL